VKNASSDVSSNISSDISSDTPAPIMVQNIFMYGNSIIVNLAVLHWQGTLRTSFTAGSLTGMWENPITLALLVNQATIGIVVGREKGRGGDGLTTMCVYVW
jgi:hypothetical protein